jgi:hypothetical protein
MNPFFNPIDFPFEVFGFYEELLDAETFAVLGVRNVTEPARPLGSPGTIELWLTEPVELRKGLNYITVKASPKRPRKVRATLQAYCGKLKSLANKSK